MNKRIEKKRCFISGRGGRVRGKMLFVRGMVIAALMLTVAACSDDDDRDASFNIAGIDVTGMKYLALGAQGSDDKGEVESMLYSVDENGNMQVVAYEYDCDDNGMETELSRNITLSITQIVPVGDNYVWLVGCRYVCTDYSGFSESMQDRIKGMVDHSKWSDVGENFLIRKSDGKIFDLGPVIGCFPIKSYNIPGYGKTGIVSDNGIPIDGDITGDKLRKLGLINQIGRDIYLATGSWLASLNRLSDEGSTLSVSSVMPGKQLAYSITDNKGHLGTTIGYTGNHPDVASIMAPDGTLPAIQGIPVGTDQVSFDPEMRCIGGKFFVSVHVEQWETDTYYDSIYLVDVSTSPATARGVARGYFTDDEYETIETTVYVSDEENYTWVSGTTLYTFNANTYQLTTNTLPAGWPAYSRFDAEGFFYEAHINNGLRSFTIYNLATLQTEEVTCNRAQVPSFNFMNSCSYDGGIEAFVESVIMADGSTVSIVTPVSGPERGVSRVESRSEPNNNVRIATLIPLN